MSTILNVRNNLYPSKRHPGFGSGTWMAGLLLAAAALLLNPTARAQGGLGGPPPPGAWGGHGGPGGPGPKGFGHDGPRRPVTGEPYSAQAVTTMQETLPNGSHISRQIAASIARDSEGRTMRSESFNGFGGSGNPQTGATITTIFDSVANQRIELNSKTKIARVFILSPEGSGSGDDRPVGPRGQHPQDPDHANVQTQSLGTQTIAGVPAQGTQTTRTIPAGAIGNDAALEITEQRWYSPDLEIVVQSSRNDPRFGQTTYVLNNLQRSEPSASLFQVPAGYQTKTFQPPPHR